jgi:hypothetical protein
MAVPNNNFLNDLCLDAGASALPGESLNSMSDCGSDMGVPELDSVQSQSSLGGAIIVAC